MLKLFQLESARRGVSPNSRRTSKTRLGDTLCGWKSDVSDVTKAVTTRGNEGARGDVQRLTRSKKEG